MKMTTVIFAVLLMAVSTGAQSKAASDTSKAATQSKTTASASEKSARRTFAQQFDAAMVSAGIEGDARLAIHDNTTLIVEDPLASRVSAHEFFNAFNWHKACALGFTEVDYDNNYNMPIDFLNSPLLTVFTWKIDPKTCKVK